MRSALIVAVVGGVMVWLGLVLAVSLALGLVPALAFGLIVGGVSALVFAEVVLTPKPQTSRWPR